MLHRLALAWVGLALVVVGCGGPNGSSADAGFDAPPDRDGGPPPDSGPWDSGTDAAVIAEDVGPIDAGPRCPSCTGSVVTAMRSSGPPGFAVDCPAGQHVDFAGTQHWIGPGTDLITNACATEGDFEPTFYVCCEPDADAGAVDGGALDAGAGSLGNGDLCDPAASLCGAGLACCYPCGIPGCDYRCEPACAPGDPGCFDGCLLRP